MHHYPSKSSSINRFFLVIACIAIVSSIYWGCEQNVTIDLEEYEPKVVVHSLLTNDSLPRVVLTKSKPYFSRKNSDKSYETLQNALVIISYNGKSDTLTQKTRQQPLNSYNYGQNIPQPSQQESDTIPFHYFEGHEKVQTGRTYSLTILHKGTTITGETTAIDPVRIKSVTYEKDVVEQFNFSDTGRIIKAYVNDPAGIENAYRLKVEFFANLPGGSLRFDQLRSNTITLDDGVDGKRIPVEMEIPSIQPPDDANNFPDTVIAHVRVEHLTREAGEYLHSLNEQLASNNSPFAEPVIVKSNVTNGIGVFGAYALSDKQVIKVPFRN